jgi:dihydroorotate dehydrogenase (fumarate)
MDTRTSYLGFSLPHPFIAGASPYGHQVDTVRRLEDGGCAAVVLHSLFEEQITAMSTGRIRQMDTEAPEFAEVTSQFPLLRDYPFGPFEYAEHVQRVKKAVNIPVIASLNGASAESWLTFSQIIEQAGADALELNLYEVITEPRVPAAAVEDQLTNMVRDLKRVLRIPIAVKLSPFYTAFANVARRLDQAGADALVIFNRFYQPDIDLQTAEVTPRLTLSTSAELLPRLRWLAILHGRVRPALAVTGGVAEPNDGIKAILAGADAVQLVSALLRHGPGYVGTMRHGLEQWMEWNHISRLDEMRGRASLQHTKDSAAFERANYIRVLQTWLSPQRTST